ncbi:dihydrolipoamide acetyltransferase [Helicobacter pylori]|nr:dihydrolipoamide acetyltransferase [Helicobacter pylori]
MVKPLESLKLPLGHPLVEALCYWSLADKGKIIESEDIPLNFKKEVSKEDQIKFKKAIQVVHAIVNNSASSRYLSDGDQKILENLSAAKTISNELVEQALDFVSNSNVYVDFEAFKKLMLNVDNIAVGLKSYSQSQLLDLDGGHWDLEAPSTPKESVTFRFDNLPKDNKDKEMHFYACSSLKDLKKALSLLTLGLKARPQAIWISTENTACSLLAGM